MSTGIKVYIAAPWTHRRTTARSAHRRFTRAGFVCVSDWTTRQLPRNAAINPTVLQMEAVSDLQQLEHAEVFVILNLGKSEGKATELGYALMMEIPIVLVGPRTGNVFYHLSVVQQVDTIGEAITVARSCFE